MHAQRYGYSKPTLLFLHGLGTSSSDWHAQIAAFSPYYRVLVPDLLEHGQSESLTSQHGIPEMTRALSRWLQIEKIEPVIVIGVSLGAMVGLELLLKYPKQVRHAILLNGTTHLSLNHPEVTTFFYQRIWFIRLFGLDKMAETAAQFLFPLPEQDAARGHFIHQLRQYTQTRYLRLLYSLQNWQACPHLMRKNAIPVDIVSSEFDYQTPQQRITLFSQLSYRRFYSLPGLHHAAPQENPERCNQLLFHLLTQAIA